MAKTKKILEVLSGGNLILDSSQRDTRENYFEEATGLRNTGENFIVQRDFGTKAILHCPPIRPNAHIVITGASNTAPIVISTANTDGLQAGDEVFVDEIGGMTVANGIWEVGTVVANTSFELVGSDGVDVPAYTSGGIWCSNDTNTARPPITIHKAFIFKDNADNTEYPIVFGIDSSSNSRVYFYTTSTHTWTELSRFFTGALSATPSASATALAFDGLLENGASYTNANDEFNNFIVVNTAQSNETVFITDSATTGAGAGTLTVDTVVGSNGLAWVDNDTIQIYRFPCFKFNWTAGNGTSPLVDFHFIEDQRKVNILYTDSSTIPVARQAIQIMKRNERSYFYNGATYERTLPAGWYCESEYGMLNPYYINEGTLASPNTSFTALLTVSGAVTSGGLIKITTSAVHSLTTGDKVIVNGVGGVPADGMWTITTVDTTSFTLDKSVFSGTYTSGGTVQKGAETQIYDKTSGRNWMSIFSEKVTTSGGTEADVRAYLTVVYDGYQESDPIFQGFYSNAANLTAVYFLALINFALMNKNISAINIYGAYANTTTIAAGWKDSSSEYYLVNKILLNTTSSDGIYYSSDTNGKPYNISVDRSSTLGIRSQDILNSQQTGQPTIYDNLNHEVDKNRFYPTPRYAAITVSGDGIVIVMDSGDNAFRLANYNGSGALEDDNFPDVRFSAPNDAGQVTRRKVDTQGSGEVLGIEILGGVIHIIRSHVAERYDLQGVFIEILKIDCVARNSIHTTPYGLVYAGKSGIDMIPLGGGGIETLNKSWDEFYNGSEYVTGVTPYITDAYRNAIVAGYDETYRESWFKIQVSTTTGSEVICFRYNYQTGTWRERSLNSDDTIKHFTNSKVDKTFYIVTGGSILEYPNRDGSHIYEDDVKRNGAGTELSQSNSVLFDATLNIAEFDNSAIMKILEGFRLEFEGNSTNGMGMMSVDFLANDETVAFDTQYVRLDEIMEDELRSVEGRGELKRLRIRFYSSDDVNNGQIDIKKVVLGYLE